MPRTASQINAFDLQAVKLKKVDSNASNTTGSVTTAPPSRPAVGGAGVENMLRQAMVNRRQASFHDNEESDFTQDLTDNFKD